MLKAKNLSVRFNDLTIVENCSFEVTKGQWLMLVGPNGAGKSTIINAISGGVKYGGQILLEERDILSYKSRERARKVGVLSQNHNVGYAFSVEEVVGLGRYAYVGSAFSEGTVNENAVEQALAATNMKSLRKQSVLTLSGGELQRTFLAQVIAQNPDVLLLDEPSNHLDLSYQMQMFELIKGWVSEKNRAVISVVHDVGFARKYGTHALLLDKGRVEAYDTVESALSVSHLNAVYGREAISWIRDVVMEWGSLDQS